MSKTRILNLKIEPEAKANFEALCKAKHTTPSHEIRLFIYRQIKQFKKQSKSQ